MLKLVEIINTMPKRVCRVVLFAESKDDISQKGLDEFQDKAGFTVAGGSFIYDSNKEISVTATDGLLLPLLKYSITRFISLDTLREVGLTKEVDISGEIREYSSWNTPGFKSVDFTEWDTINDEEMKRSCLDNLLGMSLENAGIGIKKVSELPTFIQENSIPDDSTFEAFIIPTTGSKSILLNVEVGNYSELFVADYSLGGLLKTMTVAEIKSAIEQGNAPEWYNVGKYK